MDISIQLLCIELAVKQAFYGLQGHPYDCFPRDLMYIYFLLSLARVCVRVHLGGGGEAPRAFTQPLL